MMLSVARGNLPLTTKGKSYYCITIFVIPMMIEIDPHSGVPIYRQIFDQVQNQVMTGQMEEGERLEQVRSLAARLKVNPMTVSKAYGLLEREGLVERKRGVGLFVARIRKDVQKRIKSRMLEQGLRDAAALAVQMDVPERDARELFENYYRQYNRKKQGGRHEP